MTTTNNNLFGGTVAEVLEENTLKVYPGMPTEQFNHSFPLYLDTENIPKEENLFNYNNSTLFIANKGEYHSAPYTEALEEFLLKNDFKKEPLYVPFSNGDIPLDENERILWNTLRQRARETYK